MTDHARPEPKAAEKPVPEEKARLKGARKVLAEYRKAHPDDPRADDELMHLPYGPLEVADLDEHHEVARAERFRRLRASHKKGE